MRTLVLVAGVLLVVALGLVLAVRKWRNPFSRRDLPHRLGVDIQQEANGFTRLQFRAGQTLYKIHASRERQLTNNHVLLHEVRIEMYGADGSLVDSIEGQEFEWDENSKSASAAGPVEITLARPGKALAIAPKDTSAKALGNVQGPIAAAAKEAEAAGEIHVKTSGLTFDQATGIANTSQYVEFASAQASGNAVGASYDSQQGRLVLEKAVEMETHRGTDVVKMTAQHAEFDRDDQKCRLSGALAAYRGGDARAAEATIEFRDDGSASRLDATRGVVLTTATGRRLTAPTGALTFDDRNQPTHGHLEGGVTFDSDEKGRTMHGTAPTAELEFAAGGVLHMAHLERGVKIASEEQGTAGGAVASVRRTWNSPVADLEFRNTGDGDVELSTIHGTGGVVVASASRQSSGAESSERLAADDVLGEFGDGSTLTEMTGVGHAGIEETGLNGTRQTASGGRLEAHFETPAKAGAQATGGKGTGGAAQIESATVVGSVVMTQQQVAKPGEALPAAMRATADRAVYEGDGEWLHLMGNPRVENGGLQLTADKIDFSRASGNAFAHGDVKASWLGNGAGKGAGGPEANLARGGGPGLGGQGPAHVIATEAELDQTTGEATFRGQARLWQEADSINAPVIVLDRVKQTVGARTANAAEPVRVVLVSAADAAGNKARNDKASGPQVIRLRGGDFKYSEGERKAVMHGGGVGDVVAEAGGARTHSNELELYLLPAGNHAGKEGGPAQVDRMIAHGHVTIDSESRKGTGERLEYSGETGNYVLTGTSAAPPRMSDPLRGTVTGEALIFNSRDDSVNVEGGSRKTVTETTAPK
jgi:lipopolysaccharide export system protein LptA